MITLTLLHPTTSKPVQSWTFEPESAIRIGRSQDNDVVLFSAVVSRHHLEIRPVKPKLSDKEELFSLLRYGKSAPQANWEIISTGTNGTYVDGKSISQITVEDGMIIAIGDTGPRIRIRTAETASEEMGKVVFRKSSTTNSSDRAVHTQTFITARRKKQ